MKSLKPTSPNIIELAMKFHYEKGWRTVSRDSQWGTAIIFAGERHWPTIAVSQNFNSAPTQLRQFSKRAQSMADREQGYADAPHLIFIPSGFNLQNARQLECCPSRIGRQRRRRRRLLCCPVRRRRRRRRRRRAHSPVAASNGSSSVRPSRSSILIRPTEFATQLLTSLLGCAAFTLISFRSGLDRNKRGSSPCPRFTLAHVELCQEPSPVFWRVFICGIILISIPSFLDARLDSTQIEHSHRIACLIRNNTTLLESFAKNLLALHSFPTILSRTWLFPQPSIDECPVNRRNFDELYRIEEKGLQSNDEERRMNEWTRLSEIDAGDVGTWRDVTSARGCCESDNSTQVDAIRCGCFVSNDKRRMFFFLNNPTARHETKLGAVENCIVTLWSLSWEGQVHQSHSRRSH